MAKPLLLGDRARAGLWVGFAKKKLRRLKLLMAQLGVPRKSKIIRLQGVNIEVASRNGRDRITIFASPTGGLIFICHVGADTGINGYTKKFYKLEGATLVEVSASLSDKTFTVEGMTLLDDGKYYLDYDLVTRDDPDGYDYFFNPTGLVAECGSGEAIKSIVGKAGRFMLNQAFEDIILRAVITTVDGTDRSYLFLEDSLTFRPYKIKGNSTFNRYTEDSILYAHTRTTHEIGSPVLRLESYGANGFADGFGDGLQVINKIYDKLLSDGSKTEITINSDSNGSALYGATKFYRNKQKEQDLGRVKTFFGGADFAEPAVRESYGAGAVSETLYRAADESTNTFFMKGDQVFGSLQDPGGHVKMPPNFPHLADDIKLPYTHTDEDKLTYVRMQKDSGYTTLNTGLYVADQLIEESGVQDVLVYADGTGGVADSTTGRWIAENNGPIVVKKTAYTILHAHHDANFDAVLYKKTVMVEVSDELLPYKQLNVLGDQLDPVIGQIRKTCVESLSTYHIAVNGVITDLDYSYTAREYTLTAQTTADGDGSHPQIFTFQDLPWVDIDSEPGNTQMTRIFTNATNKELVFCFDVWLAESRHDLIYDDSNPAFKYIWAEYDTSFTDFPPLVDLQDIEARKWILFDVAGAGKEIDTPKDEGVDFKRVNGVLMVTT